MKLNVALADHQSEISEYNNQIKDKELEFDLKFKELKSDIEVGLPIYVICGAILAVLIGGGTFLGVRKRIRDKY